MFIVKFMFAILAFIMSIVSYVLLKFMGAIPSVDGKPDEFDVTWSYVGKALAGVLALMSMGLWYMVFAI